MTSLEWWMTCAVVALPASVFLASWITLATGKPYSRARRLAGKLLKLGMNVFFAELGILLVWAIGLSATIPVVVPRAILGEALAYLPAVAVWAIIDKMRGGITAAKDDGSEPC